MQQPAAAVAIAKRRERVLSHLAEQPKCTRAMINRACATLELSRAMVFRLLARYKQDPRFSVLLPRRRDESVAHTPFSFRRARAHDQPPDSEGRRDGRESIPSLTPSQDRRRLQKAPASHSFVRDGTATAACLRRAHYSKEVGASGTFSVYCSTEKAVYTLTVNAECMPKSMH